MRYFVEVFISYRVLSKVCMLWKRDIMENVLFFFFMYVYGILGDRFLDFMGVMKNRYV